MGLRSVPTCRCRPGESPVWRRLEMPTATGVALRREASAVNVPVDAWIAVMCEFALALEHLGAKFGSTSRASAAIAALVEGAPISLAASGEARAWQTTLTGRAPAIPDELPEVVLPERLWMRVGGPVDVDPLLARTTDWPLARDCELVASGTGRTLETWVAAAGSRPRPRHRAVVAG